MFDHVGLQVRDLETARRFYRAALAPLGHVQDESGTGFGPKGAPALWLYETKDKAVARTHLAFGAATREAVERFHRAGLEAGARDNGGPGLRAEYGPGYFAAFLVDPDGNNVEAVCLAEA
ncbi:VOC family protein [Luteimonas sp. RD2P54]|uniref:VOC family protein n=1 Tax=Luteimonas endophytica TaxID=3042023 RepID=A0ABT6J584_9GAMM|nr:VOC family protein [Luteimonas endophytica]MDH5821986.1 VOC family protein [Luteimonas endophytica]